ncbi:MAG: DNA topoisomerase IV subunit A [Deltaproteobacteria bacterium]|nr:DNA topoisomerase IV subunit A [Deltaproteobacteria bacterium]
MTDRRSLVLEIIRGAARGIADAVAAGRRPELRVPARTLANVFYDPARGYFELGDKQRLRTLSVRTARSFAQTLKLMAVARELVESGDFATKREAYYLSKNWGDCRFEDQSESDSILDDIEALAAAHGITRDTLGFFPESHGGSVAGSLTVIDESGPEPVTVDCRALGRGAYSVPRSLDGIRFETDAELALIIETGGMFQRLASHRFWERTRCVLVEMAGVPTRATRRFVRALADDAGLPIYVFTDCDPYGFANIYRTLKAGSGNAAHAARLHSVPSARFLGVTPADIDRFDLHDATHPLTDSDRKRAQDALDNDPFFQAHPRWQQAIERLLDMGVRAEQQALAKWGLNFVLDEYLPAKLASPDEFLP